MIVSHHLGAGNGAGSSARAMNILTGWPAAPWILLSLPPSTGMVRRVPSDLAFHTGFGDSTQLLMLVRKEHYEMNHTPSF